MYLMYITNLNYCLNLIGRIIKTYGVCLLFEYTVLLICFYIVVLAPLQDHLREREERFSSGTGVSKMSTWLVTNRITGAVVYAYTADEPTEWPGMEFATCNHVAEIPVEIPAPSRRATKLQFRNLFTTVEKVGIDLAAIDNPTADTTTRIQSASLRVFLEDLSSATPDPDGTSIDLDDPRTVAGVNALESFGLIAAGRATEILSGNGL